MLICAQVQGSRDHLNALIINQHSQFFDYIGAILYFVVLIIVASMAVALA